MGKHSIDAKHGHQWNILEKKISDDPSETSSRTQGVGIPEYEYVTGIKLWSVLAVVTLVAFLMMLDMSIIVTVIVDTSMALRKFLINSRLFQGLPVTSTHSLTLVGTGARIYCAGIYCPITF
jgi:hypothetical protein